MNTDVNTATSPCPQIMHLYYGWKNRTENRNGKFYTPDGQNLWDVLSERYRKMAEQGEAGSFKLENYYDHYRHIAKEGWNRGNDANLTVGYKNGTLYDVEQYRKI